MNSSFISKWLDQYKDKEISIENLSKYVKPGSRIFLGTGCSEPLLFSQELLKEKYRWFDCHLLHFLSLSNMQYFSEEYPTHFRHNTLSIIGSEEIRKAVNNGKSDFTPIKSSEIPQLLRRNILPVDVAFLQVSMPDEYGYCSLGINVDISLTVAEIVKTLIVQINPQVPFTNGNSTIHFSDIDHFIYHDSPLMEYFIENESEIKNQDKSEKVQKMGRFLNRLINDGSTINVGLGSLPSRIWPFLTKKQNLAIYSEVLIFSDALLELIQSGVINCKKNYYPQIMTAFVMGTQQHYRYLHRNPFIKLFPVEYLTNLFNIAQNYQLISIYSAIAVDLLGNLTNHLPESFYSGIGGEHDFIVGSNLSSKGKTIILLPSTAKQDSISRIIPLVQRSNIPASDVHYVITEWGIARLKGKNLRERALQLIGVAHPKFRKNLLESAKKMHLVYDDQILPLTKDGIVVVYPEKYEWNFKTRKEVLIQFRPVKPTDEELYQRFFYKLGQEDRYFRFLSPKKIFPHEQTQKDVNIDYQSNMVILGLYGDEDAKEVVSVGSYYLEPSKEKTIAEIAITVGSQWQHQGIGFHLFKKLIEIGIENEIEGFYGEIAHENQAILAILNHLPYKVHYQYLEDIIIMEITF